MKRNKYSLRSKKTTIRSKREYWSKRPAVRSKKKLSLDLDFIAEG